MFRIGGHVFGLTVLGLLAACGSDDGAAPTPSDLVLEKAPSNSGDKQVGVAAEPLPQDLRARVTRNGEPVEGVTVYWSTRQGSVNPPVDVTDAEGISSSRWTTKFVYVEQEAFANLPKGHEDKGRPCPFRFD